MFINIKSIAEASHEQAIKHSQTAMIISDEDDQTLLEITYDSNSPVDVLISTVSLCGLTPNNFKQLEEKAANLKEKKLARSVSNYGKIGRNGPCLCGSRKKFKRCCMQ